MEEKNTLLRLESCQRDAEGAGTEQTDTYRARISESGGVITLRYAIEGDEVTMRMEDSAVEIIRRGALQMKLFIRPGRLLTGVYATPYGEMRMAAQGRRIQIQREEKRCELRMEYDVYINGEKAFANDVRAVFRR